MPREVAAICAVLLLLLAGLTGCEKGPPPPLEEQANAQPQFTSEQVHALQQLQSYAQQNGLTLADVMQRLTQAPAPQASQASTSTAIPSLQPDLKVLGWLLGVTKKSAASQDVNSTNDWLKQASRMARTVLAEMPSQVVAADLERALAAASAQPADTAGATQHVNDAIDYLARTPDQTLVPDVAPKLKALAGQMATAANATSDITSLLSACGGDKAAVAAYRICQGLDNARDALGREDWPVVTAEMVHSEALLTKIGDMAAGPVATPTTPTAPASGAAAPAAGATSTPQSQPAAPASTKTATPPATGPAPAGALPTGPKVPQKGK